VAEFQESGQKAEKEMAKQADDVKRKLQEQISKKIKEYGEKNGFTLIAAELLYSDGNHQLTDVTDEVIRELDK
jgi:Skp family chaperone for outer membrane proteins